MNIKRIVGVRGSRHYVYHNGKRLSRGFKSRNAASSQAKRLRKSK